MQRYPWVFDSRIHLQYILYIVYNSIHPIILRNSHTAHNIHCITTTQHNSIAQYCNSSTIIIKLYVERSRLLLYYYCNMVHLHNTDLPTHTTLLLHLIHIGFTTLLDFRCRVTAGKILIIIYFFSKCTRESHPPDGKSI